MVRLSCRGEFAALPLLHDAVDTFEGTLEGFMDEVHDALNTYTTADEVGLVCEGLNRLVRTSPLEFDYLMSVDICLTALRLGYGACLLEFNMPLDACKTVLDRFTKNEHAHRACLILMNGFAPELKKCPCASHNELIKKIQAFVKYAAGAFSSCNGIRLESKRFFSYFADESAVEAKREEARRAEKIAQQLIAEEDAKKAKAQLQSSTKKKQQLTKAQKQALKQAQAREAKRKADEEDDRRRHQQRLLEEEKDRARLEKAQCGAALTDEDYKFFEDLAHKKEQQADLLQNPEDFVVAMVLGYIGIEF
jgi:hypothetical protein